MQHRTCAAVVNQREEFTQNQLILRAQTGFICYVSYDHINKNGNEPVYCPLTRSVPTL